MIIIKVYKYKKIKMLNNTFDNVRNLISTVSSIDILSGKRGLGFHGLCKRKMKNKKQEKQGQVEFFHGFTKV